MKTIIQPKKSDVKVILQTTRDAVHLKLVEKFEDRADEELTIILDDKSCFQLLEVFRIHAQSVFGGNN